MNLNLLQSIEAGIRESEAIFLESEVQELSVTILKSIENELQILVEMRIAQKSYFRRKNEDTLSRAKKLEKLADIFLEPIDMNRNLPIQSEFDIKSYII